MERNEVKAGQLVRWNVNGQVGVTTDTPRVRTPNVAIQLIGGRYPILVPYAELTEIELGISLGGRAYDLVVEVEANSIIEQLGEEISDNNNVLNLLEQVADNNEISLKSDEYGDYEEQAAENLEARVFDAVLSKVALGILGIG